MGKIPEMDFETYSEAGYVKNEKGRWVTEMPSATSGIACVGAPVYTEHPTAEILCLCYDLKDGLGARLWVPGMPNPQDLFEHIARGGLIEAHNSGFEYLVWTNIGTVRHGWPELPLRQLRCSMSKAQAFAIPSSLEKAGETVGLPQEMQKDKEGKRLLKLFSCPQNPTKKQPKERVFPIDAPEDAQKLYNYCLQDIRSEEALSDRLPPLEPGELDTWLMDQEINMRGVQIDVKSLNDCLAIVDAAFEQYNAELRGITNGRVETAAKLKDLQAYLEICGVHLKNMQSETIDAALDKLSPGPARRALEIRASIGSAAVKKLYAMKRMTSKDGRLRCQFNYYGGHTGRFAGKGVQPQNLPNSGPTVANCSCGAWFSTRTTCPACGQPVPESQQKLDWNPGAVEYALAVIATRKLDLVEYYFGDAVAVVSGCLRGLCTASPGKDIINSDYTAIEAVVLACMAGEEWRIDVFRSHGKIYEMSASKISGIPFQEFMDHKAQTGHDHPLRKKLGKVAELASGYQGGLGAWKRFGADKFMTDDEIEAAKNAWRKESPMIVNFWYGVERAATSAIQHPGTHHEYRGHWFCMQDGILWLRLLSGRYLKYHKARLTPEVTQWGEKMTITYWGLNSETHSYGWIYTYGGRLTENITQATARDIFVNGMKNVTAAGYPIVLHTHDEIGSEVPVGYGSVEEYEQLMTTLPDWCKDWPIKADGGWRGKRYRK